MAGIDVFFGTMNPVNFKEKGCDTEFSARITGYFEIEECPEEKFGQTDEERRVNLKKLGVKMLTARLERWHEVGKILTGDGSRELERMLTADLEAEGIKGFAKIKTISIPDEVNGLYEEQIVKPYMDAVNKKTARGVRKETGGRL